MADVPVQEIRYVCVARRTDNVVVAQRVHTPARATNYFQNVKRVLDSPGWATISSDKLTLDDGDNTFYVLIDDSGRAFIAVASKAYPARHMYDSTDGRSEGFLGGAWGAAGHCARARTTAPTASHGCVLFAPRGVPAAAAPAALSREFGSRFGEATLTCAADEYTSKAKTLLKELCDRWVAVGVGIPAPGGDRARVDRLPPRWLPSRHPPSPLSTPGGPPPPPPPPPPARPCPALPASPLLRVTVWLRPLPRPPHAQVQRPAEHRQAGPREGAGGRGCGEDA